MENLVNTPGQPPPNYVDVLDDDYWLDQIFRAPRLVGFLPIERLEKQLQADAWAELQQRAEAEPEERRAERLKRERRLRELVLRAIETDDPGIWEQVDAPH